MVLTNLQLQKSLEKNKITYGGFIWYNTIQNSIDTLQRFQSSLGRSGEGVKQTGKPNYKDYVKAEKGQRTPNFTPKGAKRSGAFNEAKRASGIPVNEQPTKVTPAVDKRGNPIPGRDYHFKDGKIIREHSGGHTYPDDPSQNRGSHFNDVHGDHYDY
ncbi:HNH/endonuclease VII fold putative polymorphic toxin [Bacillus cereus]|uniref:HNH/endonuclease VII fold putative polymorphic toxin n=1 Tax=Bacillus cereus TaxID=1396 RepID=UPI00397F7A0A